MPALAHHDRDENSKELHYSRSDIGEVSFIVNASSGFNDSTSFEALERFFDPEYIKNRAVDVSFHGGRGQTILFTMPHQYIGALYGPKQDPAFVVAKAKKQAAAQQAAAAAVSTAAAVADAATASASSGAGVVSEATASGGVLFAEHAGSSHNLPSYPLCLRQYRRGGFVGKFIKHSFLRCSRFAQRARLEFALTAQLYEQKLPVPRPLIAREVMGTFTVENAIVVEQIPHSRNLAEIIATGRPLSTDELKLIGNTLAHFFVAHVWHSDLNLRNILLTDAGKCYVIDFDKCECRKKFGAHEVEQMLSRLERSFAKEKMLKQYDFLDVGALMRTLSDAVRQA